LTCHLGFEYSSVADDYERRFHRSGNAVSDIRFDGRVAVVTGAGGSLGGAYALLLATRGAKVVVNDLGTAVDGTGADAAVADKVVAEIRAAGGKAVADYHPVDTVEGGEGIVKTALDSFGRLDILINNAGITRPGSFHRMREEDWDRVISVHLKGAFCVTQPAVRRMHQNRYGRIVFVTSGVGLFWSLGVANYGAAKTALLGLMNALKLEVGRSNIVVNCIAPGADSRIWAGTGMSEEVLARLRPDLVSPMLAYLCSDECQTSGNIFNAVGGCFSRTAVVEGQAVSFDPDAQVTPEQIRDNIDRLVDMTGCEEFSDGIAQMKSRLLPHLKGRAAGQ
jgi:NAD(P)-dependent dehydrogenase (short-subunit alcohol dehydrogenase family)